MTLPTFIIIGAGKTGTTSLHYYLDQHPQIGMSRRKETNFFIEPDNVRYPATRVETLQEYEELFDPAVEMRGEASPSYAEYPRHKGAPESIKELIPDARLIYLVRDPVQRTISHYLHNVAMEGERKSLRDALGEPLREASRDLYDTHSPYICASLYATQLERYLRHFPYDSMLVIDQADLLADRRATLREVFTFLSVDPAFDSPQFDEEYGTTRERRTYSTRYLRWVERIAVSPLHWLPRDFRRALRRSFERTVFPPLKSPAIDHDLHARLTELYSDEVKRLRDITGKAFSSWSI